jgi:hypothetical protein
MRWVLMMSEPDPWVEAFEQYEVDNEYANVDAEDFLAGWNAGLTWAEDKMRRTVSGLFLGRGM